MKLNEFLKGCPDKYCTRERYERETAEWETVDKHNKIFQYLYWDETLPPIEADEEPGGNVRFWVDRVTEEVYLSKPENWNLTEGNVESKPLSVEDLVVQQTTLSKFTGKSPTTVDELLTHLDKRYTEVWQGRRPSTSILMLNRKNYEAQKVAVVQKVPDEQVLQFFYLDVIELAEYDGPEDVPEFMKAPEINMNVESVFVDIETEAVVTIPPQWYLDRPSVGYNSSYTPLSTKENQ